MIEISLLFEYAAPVDTGETARLANCRDQQHDTVQKSSLGRSGAASSGKKPLCPIKISVRELACNLLPEWQI